MELNKKRYTMIFIGMGLFLFLWPVLVNLISFSGRNEIRGDWAFPCVFLSINLPLMSADKPRRFRMKLLLYAMLPLFACVFGGYVFLALISHQTVNWLRELFTFAVMAPLGLSVGLFMVWLTSQPTPKQYSE